MSFSNLFPGGGDASRIYGLVVATVTAIQDDGFELQFNSSRIDAKIPRARFATLMAGNERGTFFMPEVNDEVVVGFEMGDVHKPIILGALWSDVDRPPQHADTGSTNNVRTIVSRCGHQLTFDDSPGANKITLKSNGGLEITIQDQPTPKITIKTNDGGVNGSKIELDGVAWNHYHNSGTGPTLGPISLVPVP